MYLLYDDKTTTPISYLGLSIILHGLAVILITNVAMKMAELKPLKKEVIEFELATKAILQPVLPAKIDMGEEDKNKNLSQSKLLKVENVGAAAKLEKLQQKKSLQVEAKQTQENPEQTVLLNAKVQPLKAKSSNVVSVKSADHSRLKVVSTKANNILAVSTKVKDTDAQEVTASPKLAKTKTQEVPAEPSDDFSPQEDFNKMELKGAVWHEDANTEPPPEVKEQPETDESLNSLNKKYESSDLESDLNEADQKNLMFAQAQEKKLAAELAKDSKALTENTEKYIENEKKKKFIVPPKKQSMAGVAKSGLSLDGASSQIEQSTLEEGSSQAGQSSPDQSISQAGAHSAKGSANVAGIENGDKSGRNIKQGKSLRFGHSVNGGSTQAQEGVRALRDLRQMPGNIKPQYSLADRRASKQGDVVYNAFIGSSGRPERFVLIKSSGHQSLDQNTLLALKKWRFYPGQEGWVELPFRWSLTGGATEAPSLLRR